MTPYEQLITNSFGCDWANSPYIFFSGNVFSPLIYYSHLVPMIAALLLAFIVWRQHAKSLINDIFITLVLLFASWVALDLLLWADVNPGHIMFAWTTQVYIDPLIYFVAFYLVYVFVKKRDLPFGFKLIGVVLLAPVILAGPTAHTLTAFNYTNCDREAIEGLVWQYVYFIEAVVLGILILFSSYSAWKSHKKDERLQIFLFAGGIALFLAGFSFGNIVGSFTQDWTVAQYGLFGMPLFLGTVLYLMTRFNAFRIGALSTSVLVWSLWFLLFSILFLNSMEVARPIIIGTLVIFSLMGRLLVRSVKLEIEQKDQIQLLATNLEKVNGQQVILIHFITHQIKGFVAKSRNIFSLMLDGDFGILPEPAKNAAQVGFESDTKGAQTIAEILNAANIKSGKVEYKMVPFDLKALIEETIQDLKAAADKKGLALNASLEPVTFAGDRGQLINAFKNLIDNSIKYTPTGSVSVSLTQAAGKIRFEIKDTGVGIGADDMKNLFTEGGHGKDSQKINVESTGFGLYIVRNIIEAHKGRVWVESEGEGKGSHFFVELPA